MNKRLLFTFFTLAGIYGFCFAGGSVNQFILPNGIKVLHKEITQNPLITIQLFTACGNIAEKEDQAGLATLTQVLLFQGTKTRSAEQLAKELEEIGGGSISDIENDFSTMGISVLDKHTDKAFEILSDVIFHPAFPETEIEKERTNILAGIKSRQDSIFQVADDAFINTFYGNHPYSWPDCGKKETVSKFTRQDILDWHKEHFVPQGSVLVIAGNIGLDKAKAMAEKYFAVHKTLKACAQFPAAEPPSSKSISKELKKFQQAYYMTGFAAPQLKDPDFTVLKVLNATLGGRMSGRLFTELREKMSLAYEVNSFYPTRRQLSRFVIYIGLDGKNLGAAKKRIDELIADLKSTPIPEQELADTKKYLKGVYLLDHQTVARQAWYMGWWEIMGAGFAYDDKYIDGITAVTASDIQKAAQKYFTDTSVKVEIISK